MWMRGAMYLSPSRDKLNNRWCYPTPQREAGMIPQLPPDAEECRMRTRAFNDENVLPFDADSEDSSEQKIFRW
jgi:hypothetical protein